jgi:O-antigen/teichoic acid export membrane protein
VIAVVEDVKKKALLGAVWLVAGFGLSQAIRLGGNLVLTRILVPELFGVMSLANVFIMGLHLFSDFGLEPGIIRSTRGDEADFLNTAWTMQVIRGAALWFFTLLIAWPVARFYAEPTLQLIIPVIGLGCLVAGFNATAIVTLNKNLQLRTLALMELFVQLVGLACTIALAYVYRNVWAMVTGGLVAAVIKTILSHFLDTNCRNRFALDRAAVKELVSFGKWIFVSTAMMFLATQADRLLLGKLFPLALLGIYSIAVTFAEMPKQIVTHLSSQLVFPLIAQYSHLPRHELRFKILHARRLLLPPLALVVALLVSFGDVLISALYDERYHQAGWMLPLLALGMWPLLLYATVDRCLYVVSPPKFPAMGNFLKFLWMMAGVPFFYMMAGNFGALLAVALNDTPMYLAVNYGLKRERLSGLGQDGWGTLLLLGLIGIMMLCRYYAGMGFPGEAVFVP